MKPRGGTELQFEFLEKHVSKNFKFIKEFKKM